MKSWASLKKGAEYQRSFRAREKAKGPEYAKRHVADVMKYHTTTKRGMINARFAIYRINARKRDISFDLTKEEFSLFWQKPCWYCDCEIKTLGIDRIDNNRGYVLGNVLPCCKLCNWSKSNGTQEDFLARCRRVSWRHPEKIWEGGRVTIKGDE